MVIFQFAMLVYQRVTNIASCLHVIVRLMIRHEIWGYCTPHFRQTYVTVRIYVQRFGFVRKCWHNSTTLTMFVHRIHH